MKILMLYASSQGQTRKIMAHLADRLAAAGQTVELVEAGSAPAPEAAGFDAAILGGSIHAGHYQPALVGAAKQLAPALAGKPVLFLSVSLTAAGDDPEDRAELDRVGKAFLADVGLEGAERADVAGAFRFEAYNFFEYWAMRWIARRKGVEVAGRPVIEFTDWAALEALVDAWLERIAARR